MSQFQSYQLVLLVAKDLTIEIGALGKCRIKAGKYIYTGSAKRNMEKRIARHFKKEKPIRWHIDYLTSHPEIRILRVERFTESECEVNRRTGGEIIIPGFGAGDCRNRCVAHLKYVESL